MINNLPVEAGGLRWGLSCVNTKNVLGGMAREGRRRGEVLGEQLCSLAFQGSVGPWPGRVLCGCPGSPRV